MSTFQLTVSDTYVPDWTYIQGLREFFQNAIDNESIDSDNKMYFEYNEDEETLYIGNKNSVLTRESLLFGYSTKRGDNRTIGSHGEGYKIAILVLLREGKGVTFYNRGVGEVWTTRLVNSRKYNAVIPEIKSTKKLFTKKDIDSNLVIEITNITKSEYVDFKETVLQLRGYGEHKQSPNGKVLLDADLKGKLFVNGLYVSTEEELEYGYDFRADKIKLDRDRKMLRNVDVKIQIAYIISQCKDADFIADAITQGYADVEFISSGVSDWFSNRKEELDARIIEKRVTKDSSRYYPVSSNQDIEDIDAPVGVKPLVVSKFERDILRSSGHFYTPDLSEKSVSDRLEAWYDDIKFLLNERDKTEFMSILSDLKRSEA